MTTHSLFFLLLVLPFVSACNMNQFGKTCSLPLGANCPWRTPASVPLMYKFKYHKRPQGNPPVIHAVITQIGYKYNVTKSPICQIIFPFPLDRWLSLNSTLTPDEFKYLLSKIPDAGATGIVTDITNIKPLATTTDKPGFVRSHVGKVLGAYGYYIYNSPKAPFPTTMKLYIPKVIFDRIPRIPPNIIEYSFYGSEAYCRIQNVTRPIKTVGKMKLNML
jgi:hypothetical protein